MLPVLRKLLLQRRLRRQKACCGLFERPANRENGNLHLPKSIQPRVHFHGPSLHPGLERHHHNWSADEFRGHEPQLRAGLGRAAFLRVLHAPQKLRGLVPHSRVRSVNLKFIK